MRGPERRPTFHATARLHASGGCRSAVDTRQGNEAPHPEGQPSPEAIGDSKRPIRKQAMGRPLSPQFPDQPCEGDQPHPLRRDGRVQCRFNGKSAKDRNEDLPMSLGGYVSRERFLRDRGPASCGDKRPSAPSGTAKGAHLPWVACYTAPFPPGDRALSPAARVGKWRRFGPSKHPAGGNHPGLKSKPVHLPAGSAAAAGSLSSFEFR